MPGGVDPDTAAELVRATHRAARAVERAAATLRWLLHAVAALALLHLTHLAAYRSGATDGAHCRYQIVRRRRLA